MSALAPPAAASPRQVTGGGLTAEPALEATLAAIARAALPYEACGFLGGTIAGDGHVLASEAVAARNCEAGDRRRHFFIDPADLAAAERRFLDQGCDLIGFFHSHPGGRPVPSAEDIRRASGWPGYIHCIIGLTPDDRYGIQWYRTNQGHWLDLNISWGIAS
jgi:proteasome lid subunit RPN8/RPN11